ncbi:MAG TPA: T9SS type A sorting domain-containing protein [Cyclobacteriaceae bacterium]|jgi:hypothetical protein|nr:T9SS type A sorting domain-containing protein [Cyclobacteriaceae bacterium]
MINSKLALSLVRASVFSFILSFSKTVYSQLQNPIHLSSISANGSLLYEPTSVFVSGNYAYVTNYINDAVEILDISNPAAPVHKGSLVDGKGGARLQSPSSICVSGNYAYVGSLSALEIIDISDRTNPMHTASIVSDQGSGLPFGENSVFVSGNYAYVATKSANAFTIVDISNPSAPLIKGNLLDGASGALLNAPSSVYVSGNFAYVVSQLSNSLEIIDISNPSAPVHKGSIVDGAGGAIMNYPSCVYVLGNYAYVASFSSSSLEVVDISNPAAPTHKGNITHSLEVGGPRLAGPRSVVVSGNYAYVVADPNTLEIVDISNPSSPQHKGNIADSKLNVSYSVFVSGNYAYVASALSSRLNVIDVSDTTTPTIAGGLSDGVGRTNPLLAPQSIFVRGDYAYVASEFSNTFEILDISDVSHPTHKGSISDGAGGAMLQFPYSVYIVENYAYVVSRRSGALEIIDISDPGAPIHKGSIVDGVGGALLANPVSVFVSGNYAYVASNSSNALEIIDVSNPAVPLHKGSLADGNGEAPFLNSLSSVFVVGNYAYVASTGSSALEIVDVTNPSAPTHAGYLRDGNGNLPYLFQPRSVFVQGNYAYLTGASSALEIVDISNPTTPVHKGAGFADPFLNLTSVFVNGGHAYVTGASYGHYVGNGLAIIDVSNLVSPLKIGSITDGDNSAMLDYPTSVFVSGGTAFVTSGSNAVEILTVPLAPPIAAVAAVTTGGFTASWTRVDGATSYQLDLSTDLFSTFLSNYGPAIVSDTALIISGINPGTAYQYRVRAVGLITSNNSNVVSITTLPLAPIAIDANNLTPSGFTANWNASYGASGYLLDISTDNFNSFINGFNALAVSGTSKALNGFSIGKYQYRVRAIDASGVSINSNVIAVCVSPPTPTITGPAKDNPPQLTLTSSAPTGNQWYINGNAIDGATNSIYVLIGAGDYTVTVTQNGCTSVSSVFHVGVVTGEISSVTEIKAFPNPGNEDIFVSINYPGLANVKIFDTMGQPIQVPTQDEGEFIRCDIRSLSPGLYILKVEENEETHDIKFVKR